MNEFLDQTIHSLNEMEVNTSTSAIIRDCKTAIALYITMTKNLKANGEVLQRAQQGMNESCLQPESDQPAASLLLQRNNLAVPGILPKDQI